MRNKVTLGLGSIFEQNAHCLPWLVEPAGTISSISLLNHLNHLSLFGTRHGARQLQQ